MAEVNFERGEGQHRLSRTVRPVATPHRYPANLGTPPYEKQMLFEVKETRHQGRRGEVGESTFPDGTIASAALYMPVDALNSTTAVNWQAQDMGPIAGAALQAFSNAANNAPVTSENIVQKLKETAAATGTGMAVATGTKLAESLAGLLGGGGVSGKHILQSMFGQQVDPRTDMLFQGVEYRRHVFTFTLIPRNRDEAVSINQILNLFQFYMLPRYGGPEDEVNLDSFFIGFPYEFDITLITNPGIASGSDAQSLHINKIDRSVLTSCQINHAAGDHVAFVGEYYPAATELILNFTEVRLQGRDRYTKKLWRGQSRELSDPNSIWGWDEAKALGGDVLEGTVAAVKERLGLDGDDT